MYKLFSSSALLSMKFFMLLHVKMPTNVGFLKSISMINTTAESLKDNAVTAGRLKSNKKNESVKAKKVTV